MIGYFKICEICGHENNVSYLECEECSADISFISPTQKTEEKNDFNMVQDESNDDETEETQSNSTIVVGRIKLVRKKDNFEIYIPVKVETILGREGDLCNDYFDQSNFISRRHSTIRLNPDGYSITDHSSNGTFVNGGLLKRGQTTKINVGDIITLADLEFVVENL